LQPTKEPDSVADSRSFRRILLGNRILPLLVVDNAELAPTLMETLQSSGIGVAEIALRTPESLVAIKLATTISGMCVGAGTVLTVDQVNRVADAGAKFIVCPSFDEAVIDRARELSLPVLPGVATASEVHRAFNLDLDVVKFFPADSLGGLKAINSISGTFPTISFVPSGGVNQSNLANYLSDPAVAAVSGSWLAPRDLIHSSSFSEIAKRILLAVSALENI
jgi:2-dehydro-3-deoxyphosphogluconate aldolase/(4S)-4-hydroxy-2-oxoglutarate aldolase